MARSAKRKWTRWLLTALVIIAGAAAVVYFAVLPAVVQSRIHATLADAGVSVATFNLRGPSPFGLRLTNLKLGSPNWLHVDAARVKYSPASLSKGRARALEVTGARWRIAIKDGVVDFGPKARDDAERTGAQLLTDLPVDRVDLRDSEVIVEIDGRAMTMIVHGTAQRRAPGVFELDLDVHAHDAIELAMAGMTASSAFAKLSLRLELHERSVQLYALQDNEIDLDGLTLSRESGPMSFSPLKAAISSAGSRPLVSHSTDGSEHQISINATVASAAPLAIETAGATIGSDAVSVEVEIDRSNAQPTLFNALARVENGSVVVEQGELSLSGINLIVPVNQSSAEPGAFSIQPVVWRGESLGGLRGTAALFDNRLTLSVVWPVATDAALTSSGWIEFASGGVNAEFDALLPPFEMEHADAIRSLISKLSDIDMDFGGRWSAEGSLAASNGQWSQHVEVTAVNARISSPEWRVSIESASGTLAIDGFDPLVFEGIQTVSIHRAMLGELEATDGELSFALDSPESVSVHEASWSMGDLGQFRVEPFRFNPQDRRAAFAVQCVDVGLEPWLNLLTDDRVKGEGSLRGRLTMAVAPGRRQLVRFGEGELYAQPSTGWVQTTDDETISAIMEHADTALAASGDARVQQVRQRLVAALQDLQFSRLHIRFIPDGSSLAGRIELAGIGRTGPNPQEIGSLVFNVDGIDEAIRAAFSGKSIWDFME